MQYLVPINLAQNELQNAVVQVLAADPSSPVEGQIYYNSVSKKLRQYDGSTWVEYGTGAGSGDVSSNTATSVDGEVALFAGTNGKVIKRATGTGIAKLSSGVLSVAASGTDYAPPTTGTAALRGDGSGGFAAAVLNDVGAATGDYSINGHKLTNVADPTNPQDAATKVYVDNAVQGLAWKQPVRVATTAAGTLASSFANGQTVDGVTLVTGDRILIKNQTDGVENGIYVVAASGAPARAADANTGPELLNATVYVSEGTTNADTVWTCTTNGPITPGTTPLTFVEVNGGTVPNATTSVAGKVQLATQVETEAKANTTKAVVPADLVNFPIKRTATIGDGTNASITVNDNLGTTDKIAVVREAATDKQVEVDITYATNTTTFGFAVAPASNAYKVVIIG